MSMNRKKINYNTELIYQSSLRVNNNGVTTKNTLADSYPNIDVSVIAPILESFQAWLLKIPDNILKNNTEHNSTFNAIDEKLAKIKKARSIISLYKLVEYPQLLEFLIDKYLLKEKTASTFNITINNRLEQTWSNIYGKLMRFISSNKLLKHSVKSTLIEKLKFGFHGSYCACDLQENNGPILYLYREKLKHLRQLIELDSDNHDTNSSSYQKKRQMLTFTLNKIYILQLEFLAFFLSPLFYKFVPEFKAQFLLLNRVDKNRLYKMCNNFELNNVKVGSEDNIYWKIYELKWNVFYIQKIHIETVHAWQLKYNNLEQEFKNYKEKYKMDTIGTVGEVQKYVNDENKEEGQPKETHCNDIFFDDVNCSCNSSMISREDINNLNYEFTNIELLNHNEQKFEAQKLTEVSNVPLIKDPFQPHVGSFLSLTPNYVYDSFVTNEDDPRNHSYIYPPLDMNTCDRNFPFTVANNYLNTLGTIPEIRYDSTDAETSVTDLKNVIQGLKWEINWLTSLMNNRC
ncbi:uncharacterized protein SCDLUD_005075 [Saccharomycodes ludwigii]|uniref:uncharacterized protein n=1 Tax=Saccharomycodes ludwigii TaxID=36035 RepID=UPI001E8229EA|nr:hypothetical protein SCDLUD_005075 [Saccharomycodes ludwigii]KAH3898747.1 hypothetical protein SCDLUD_005075 [Saccharomycodes ludwigii]